MGKKVKSNVKISVILVVKNESVKLQDCLKSIDWAWEIILVDNGSSDQTQQVAKKFGAKIFYEESGTFSSRKNFAAGKAGGEWFLFIDADERVTPALHAEILSIVNSKSKSSGFPLVYAIPRRNIILGKEMTHGGWWPDYVIRLFKRENFAGFSGELHEQPRYKGRLGYINNFLLHQKHDNLSEMVEKTNEWSEVEAKLMYEAGHPEMNVLRFFSAGFREFWLRMIKNSAYMDGTEGVIYGLYQVYSRLISYAKLWEMQLRKNG